MNNILYEQLWEIADEGRSDVLISVLDGRDIDPVVRVALLLYCKYNQRMREEQLKQEWWAQQDQDEEYVNEHS